MSGDQSFATEKQHYIEEIDALRSRAAKAEELEVENARLLAELDVAKHESQRRSTIEGLHALEGKGASNVHPGSQSEARTVDVEEYDRVRDLLAKSDRDYEKAIFARQVLEFQLRRYKNMTKEWRENIDKWTFKPPMREIKSRELEASKASPAAATRDLRYSSAPAPPAPDDMTPSNSDVSRDASPRTDLERARVRQGSNPPLTTEPLRDRTVAAQRVLNDDPRASSGNVIEASDKSDPGRRLSPSSKAYSHKSTEINCGHAKKQAEDNGSSPIIVSERSLKRKRPIKMHEDDSYSKPPPVKHELPSSSPLIAPSFLRFGGLHDSVDLDDIGGHIDTPRKRRRKEELRLGSSFVSPAAVRDKEVVLDDPTQQNPGGVVSTKDELDKPTESVVSISPNPAANHKGQDNEEQQQESRKALSKMQQQAHNKRVRERLDAVEQVLIGDAYSSKSSSARPLGRSVSRRPESPSRRDYPTPATEDHVRPRTAQGDWEIEQRRAALASPTILQPTDPNAHILPRTHEKLANRKTSYPPSRRDRGAADVPAVAEDGEGSPSFSKQVKVKQIDHKMSSDKASRASDLHNRLGTLLSEPSPTKSLLESTRSWLSPPRTASSKMPGVGSNGYADSKAPSTPPSMPAQRTVAGTGMGDGAGLKQYRSVGAETSEGAKSARATNKNRTTKPVSCRSPLIDHAADTRPEHEPLRARPMHRLLIEDFKLNPAHSDYGYHESVRKHDEKQAISGCTDWNCPRCRDIRKFVESSGYARVPGLEEEETDRRLLEAFLGNDKGRLKKMSADETKEMIVQARSQQFANEFGKHRTPFQRAQSPVDYWNVGFPSTQEHEQNREAVRLRERERVKAMYWEAIRERGRYVFADE